jgi:membrane protein YqaA with SNARE-associated domain
MSALRSLYDWLLKQAEKPYAAWLLFVVAVIEPCLAPLPPDALLIPMALARRDKAIKYGLICTLGSIIGGLIGYGIGALAMKTIGHWVVETYQLQDALKHFRHEFDIWGVWIILLKGSIPVIPVPFLLVTVASGVLHFNLAKFLAAFAAARGGRFLLEAYLIHRFGEPIRIFIEKYLTWVVLGLIAAVFLWAWLVMK